MEVRASPGGGEERVVRQDMVTLPPMKWIHDSIVNFVGKVMIQPWRERDAAKVNVFSSHLMDTLLGGVNPTDPYDFTSVGRWCDRVPGSVSSLDESEPQRQPLELHLGKDARKKDRVVGLTGT